MGWGEIHQKSPTGYKRAVVAEVLATVRVRSFWKAGAVECMSRR